MYFRMLRSELSGEMTYLLADAQEKEAVLVDPHSCDFVVLCALLAEHDLKLKWVLRTHHHDNLHPDEIQSLAKFEAPLVQGDAADNTYQPHDGEKFQFGTETIDVWMTPGHTANCLSFAWRDRLFCGGLLAMTDCPYQPFAAAPAQLWESVTQRLFELPNETLLFPAHAHQFGTVSTVMDQKRCNPYFADYSRDDFLARTAKQPDKEALNSHK